MGTNFITNVIDPVNPQDVATMNYVDTIASGTPTNLNGLTDVTLAGVVLDQVLQNNGAGQWINVTPTPALIGITTATAVELDYSAGVTSAIQTQINGKLNLTGCLLYTSPSPRD